VMGVGRPEGRGVEGSSTGSRMSSPCDELFATAVSYDIVRRIHCMNRMVKSNVMSCSLDAVCATSYSPVSRTSISNGLQ
jgi:hypothetical protein